MPVHNIDEFELWQPSYGNASVTIYVAGTTTKASVYTDEALSTAADNPQTLLSQAVDSVNYGKFSVPLYTDQAYYLDIDSTDQTGVERPPLTDIDGEDLSDAEVTPTGGSVATDLDDLFGRWIHAEDYGALGASASTNTTTLTAAIGAASGVGGGTVLIPDGTYTFTQLTVPANVVLVGKGRTVTVLQSQTADNVITFSGDRAGLSKMTLDGVNLISGSVGIYSKANDEILFNDFEAKRFATGIHFKGGRRLSADNLYIDGCTTGAKFHGDIDAGGGADGDQFRNNEWRGGRVTGCSSIGLDLSYEDKKVYHNTLKDIGFEDNTGTALNINGARYTTLDGCWFSGNTGTLAVDDDDDTDSADENTIIGLSFARCDFDGGTATFEGTCQEVILSECEIADVDFTLTAPSNAILVRDSQEDSDSTLAGTGTEKWTRFRSSLDGYVAGTTSDGTAINAWELELKPGQAANIEARVTAVRQDDGGTGAPHVHVASMTRDAKGSCNGDTLNYDNLSGTFSEGETITGGTSGATATVIYDDGASSMVIINYSGTFTDDEQITGGTSSATADVNGALTAGTTTVHTSGANQVIGTDYDGITITEANTIIVATSNKVALQIEGAASKTIDWLCHVKAVIS